MDLVRDACAYAVRVCMHVCALAMYVCLHAGVYARTLYVLVYVRVCVCVWVRECMRRTPCVRAYEYVRSVCVK